MTAPAITIAACWMFGDLPPEEGVPRLRDAGIEAVEIWSQDLRRWGVPRWKAALAGSGLGCAQLCPYLDVVHGPATIEMGRWVIAAMLEAGAELVCRRIRVFTGPPWGRWTVGPGDADPERWQEAATALAGYCDQAGPTTELCLECHPGSLMENATHAQRLIALVGRPNLTVNLQLPFPGETPETSAALLAQWTTHIHIHAYANGWGGPYDFLANGTTPWAPILGILRREAGRDLCLSLEHLDHGGQHDPWETVRRDAAWLHELRDTCLANASGARS